MYGVAGEVWCRVAWQRALQLSQARIEYCSGRAKACLHVNFDYFVDSRDFEAIPRTPRSL